MKSMMRPTRLLIMAILLLAAGCTTTKRPAADRDPYILDSSSDPPFRAGNPY